MFSKAAVTLAFYRQHVILSIDDVEIIRKIRWYRVAFDSVQGIFYELTNSFVRRKAIFCASSGFKSSFFGSKNAGSVHSRLVILVVWAAAPTVPKEVLTKLKAPSTLLTESLSELFFNRSF